MLPRLVGLLFVCFKHGAQKPLHSKTIPCYPLVSLADPTLPLLWFKEQVTPGSDTGLWSLRCSVLTAVTHSQVPSLFSAKSHHNHSVLHQLPCKIWLVLAGFVDSQLSLQLHHTSLTQPGAGMYPHGDSKESPKESHSTHTLTAAAHSSLLLSHLHRLRGVCLSDTQ